MNISGLLSKIAFGAFADFLVWKVSKVHWNPQTQLSADGGTGGLKGGDKKYFLPSSAKHLNPGLQQFEWLRSCNIIWQAKTDNKVQFKLNYLTILQRNAQQTRISWEEIRGRAEINIVTHIPQFHLGKLVFAKMDEFSESFQGGVVHFRSKKFHCKLLGILNGNFGNEYP